MKRVFDNESTDHEIHSLDRPWKTVYWQVSALERFSLEIPPTVYPPREDTDLLAKCIGPGRGRRMLEIGCGSGALSILAAARGWMVEACDINPLAVACTRGNLSKTGLDAIIREGGPGPGEDSSAWFGEHRYDLIIWNLPYLRYEEGETLGPMEDAALLDTDSIGLSKRLLNIISANNILNTHGRIMLLHGDNQLMHDWRKNGWATREIASTEFEDGEKLLVTCIWQPFESQPPLILTSCESTNSELLNSNLAIGSSIVSPKQTQGKGRRGRKWFDEENSFAGSWMIEFIDPGRAQLAAGLAAIESIEALGGNAKLKWPNDILVNGKKTIGILAESRSFSERTNMAIGIGANLSCSEREREYERGSLDEVIEDIDFSNWHRVLHARMASWFERIEEGELPDSQPDSLLRIKDCGVPLYRDLIWKVIGLNESSELVLENEEESIVIKDGEHIDWDTES